MGRISAALLVALALASPAMARSVSAEADRVLWCGSAFYWLSNDAVDAGADEEADRYLGWSDMLMARGTGLLRSDKFSESEIQRLVEAYDEAVLDELGTDKARHDVAACPELVGG